MTFIAILQAVTFDTWTDPMFDIMASYSYSAWIYFILVAILGGLFVVNLFLAVIFDEFMRAQAEADAEREVTAGLREGGGGAFAVDVEAEAALIKAGSQLSNGGRKKAKPGMCDCAPRKGSCRLALARCMNSMAVGHISTGLVVLNLSLIHI